MSPLSQGDFFGLQSTSPSETAFHLTMNGAEIGGLVIETIQRDVMMKCETQAVFDQIHEKSGQSEQKDLPPLAGEGMWHAM